MAFMLRSSAFEPGSVIGRAYTCDGRDINPPLRWENPPGGTRSFALVCDDPDAPMGTWVHWVIYDIPAAARELAEGFPPREKSPDGSLQGQNDFGRIGYGGPCPPRGKPHRYFFRLYALDAMPGLGSGATRKALLKAIEGHILAQAELMGTYGRS